MSWQWTATQQGSNSTPVGPSFTSQQEAEQWLTVSYEDLTDEDWTEVSLYDAERLVYGPMSLAP